MDILEGIATLVGGGAVMGGVVYGILQIVRGSIATAVKQAGEREIERLRGQLAAELEKERQRFARELAREREAFERETARRGDEAARALEQFKAELTLEAEVRRQTAARKVEALLKLSQISIDLVRAYSNSDWDMEIGGRARYESLIEWAHGMVEVEALLGADALAQVAAFHAAATKAHVDMIAVVPGSEGAIKRLDIERDLEGARLQLFRLLRRELAGGAEPGAGGSRNVHKIEEGAR